MRPYLALGNIGKVGREACYDLIGVDMVDGQELSVASKSDIVGRVDRPAAPDGMKILSECYDDIKKGRGPATKGIAIERDYINGIRVHDLHIEYLVEKEGNFVEQPLSGVISRSASMVHA